MAQLELKKIGKKYEKGSDAVKDFSLCVEEGEFVVFVGPSGCGKSTTLRMIAGLEEITSGELWMNGRLMNYTEPKERNLSMVFQNYALYPQMNVYKNMAFGAKVRKVPKDEVDRRVRRAAELLGISHLLKSYPKVLSGGQKQRVAIGSVMVLEPKLFLMDEPLSNLDAKLRTQMRIEIAKLHKKLRSTFIYVTHDQIEAMTLGTKIVVMKQGIIQQAASPEEIYNNPKNQFVAGFMGLPAMNFLEAELQDIEGHVTAVYSGRQIRIGEKQARLLVHRGYLNKRVVLGFRPNHLMRHKEAGQPKEMIGHLQGKITHIERLGAEVIAYIQINEKEITVKLSADECVKAGEEIDVYLDMNNVYWFDQGTGDNILYEGRGNHA